MNKSNSRSEVSESKLATRNPQLATRNPIYMKKLTLVVVAIFLIQTINAQSFGLGFKTGLTLSRFNGPSETLNGVDLESNENAGGFMIGAIFKYKITDLAGIKAELLYNQKGSRFNFTGMGYQYLPPVGQPNILLTGEQRIDLDISNNYLNIPIMGYGRVGRFEFEGGVSFGVLLSSNGSGEVVIDGNSTTGTPTGRYSGILEYRFNNTNPRQLSIVSTDVEVLNVDGQMITFPRFLDAYHRFPNLQGLTSDGVFNALDIGVIGGINYYWNSTLYLGARLNYGLSDVTNNDSGYDVSRVDFNGGPRDDKDQNFSIQISLGFSF